MIPPSGREVPNECEAEGACGYWCFDFDEMGSCVKRDENQEYTLTKKILGCPMAPSVTSLRSVPPPSRREVFCAFGAWGDGERYNSYGIDDIPPMADDIQPRCGW